MAASAIYCFAARRDSDSWTLDDSAGPLFGKQLDTTPCKLALGLLLSQLDCPPLYEAIPPTYQDALEDEPPAYVNTELLTTTVEVPCKDDAQTRVYSPALMPDEGIRSHAGKKAKQAQKKAQQAKWAESGDEEEGSKGGAAGDQNGDGGSAGGAGGSGAGGDGGGWDDEDGWDDAPGKKAKKKGKKGKKDEEEEEEKEEEDAAKGAPATANFWDNLDDLNGGGDANMDDEWAGVAATGKKGNKSKKGKADPAPPPLPTADKSMDPTLDDINLDAPRIDLSFGGNDTKGNDYSFGNWGSGWGFSGLGGGANKSTADADKDAAMDSTNMWDMGAGKKDAKKKTTKKSTGFDFGFNPADDLAGEDALTSVKKDEDPLDGFTTATTKKDKKSKKTIGFAAQDDIVPDAYAPITVVESEELKEDDSFNNPWGTSKKDKKSLKKGTSTKDPDPPPPPPPPPAAAQAEVVDNWATISTKTDKKKGKKDDKAIPVSTFDLEPVSPISNGDDGGDIWGTAVSKKDKKKSKAGKEEDPTIPDMGSSDAADDFLSFGGNSSKKDKDKKKSASNAFGAIDDYLPNDLGNKTATDVGTTAKGDKKKTKKGIVDEPLPPSVPEPPAAEKDDDWMSGNIWGNSKKDNKKALKKGKAGESDSAADKKSTDGDAALKDIGEDPMNDSNDWGGSWDTSKKDKKKKDDKKNTFTEDPNTLSLLQEDSVPDNQAGDDDGPWGWGTAQKKDKKKGKKDTSIPPPVPTPPNLGLTPGSSPPGSKVGALDNMDPFDLDDWSTSGNGKTKGKKDTKKSTTTIPAVVSSKDLKTDSGRKLSKQMSKEEDPFLAIVDEPIKTTPPKEEKKSFWSSFSGGTTAKPKSAKELEKEKKEAEAEALRKEEAEAEEAAELAELAELAKKDSKKKGGASSGTLWGKSDSKTTTTSSKKSIAAKEEDEAAALAEEKPTSADEKKGASSSKKSDAWSFWGASGASAASGATPSAGTKSSSSKEKDKEIDKKEKEKEKEKTNQKLPAGRSDKEIGNDKPTNHKSALPEPTGAKINKDSPLKSNTSAVAEKDKDKDGKTSKDKDKEKARDKDITVAADSKAAKTPLDKNYKATSTGAAATRSTLSPPLPASPPRDSHLDSKAAKGGAATSTSTVTRKPIPKTSSSFFNNTKDSTAAEPGLKSGKLSSAVPGGFPLDDHADLTDDRFADMAPASKKIDKSSKKTTDKKGKDRELEIVDLPSAPSPPATDAKKKSSLLPDPKKKSSKTPEVTKLPTPPPEPETKASKKSSSRAPPRDEASSSWGFWGASAKSPSDSDKKDSKSSKADVDVAPPAKKDKSSAPGLSRSKSERKVPGKEAEKLSGSGSDEAKKADSRPAKPSRLSSMFGSSSAAPPLARSASKRESVSGATSTAQRRSGLPSPPPEGDKKMSDKAAKTLGVDKRNSMPARSQSTRDKPKMRDPFAIDEEEEFPIDPRSKDKSAASKRKSTTKSKRDSIAEDAVMVDAPNDKASRPAMKRSESSAKKSEGLMGLFGSMRKKERRPSVSEEDDPKRLRRESRRVQRSQKPSDYKGNSPGGAYSSDAEAEAEAEAEARRAERRQRRADREAKAKDQREAEQAEQADREARQQERDRAKMEVRKAQAKEERARQRQEEDDRRARRAGKDDLAAQEEEDDSERRRRRRRESRMNPDVGDAKDPTRLRQTDRRRSLQPDRRNSPYADEDDYPRRIDRRTRRSPRRSSAVAPADPSKSYRRRSGVPDEYFDPRNGVYGPSVSRGVGTDKTASWVHSVNVEPPLPPTIEGTVVETEPDLGGGTSSRLRKEPRRSDYRRERDRDRAEKPSDEGSGGRRRSEYYDDGIGSGAPLTARGLDAITATNRAQPKGAAGFLRKMGF